MQGRFKTSGTRLEVGLQDVKNSKKPSIPGSFGAGQSSFQFVLMAPGAHSETPRSWAAGTW
jgi:hypothetical protein